MRDLLKNVVFALAFLATGLCSSHLAFANPDIYIGLTPNEDVPKVKELEAELTKRLGDKVILYIGKNYEALMQAFQKGEVNFAILPPRLAVKLETTTPLRYLLKKVYGQSEYYYSAIVTLSNSPLKSLKALKGKRVGFVDREKKSCNLKNRWRNLWHGDCLLLRKN
jgi:phosphonate transport system substrate-binding protein